MKAMLLFLFLFVCSNSYGWECLARQKGNETSYEKHIEYASEIYSGRVLTSYLVKDIHKIVFEFEVADVFKGHYKSHITLETTDDGIEPDITIGFNYIFFLYGSNSVDFCSLTVPLGKGFYKPEHLEYYAKNVESENKEKAAFLRKLLKMRNKNP